MSQKDTSYVHIVSTLCFRNTIRKYNAGGYTSVIDITIHLGLFVLISYIFDFRKYRQMIEYIKYQWIHQKQHDVLQWDRNAQNTGSSPRLRIKKLKVLKTYVLKKDVQKTYVDFFYCNFEPGPPFWDRWHEVVVKT